MVVVRGNALLRRALWGMLIATVSWNQQQQHQQVAEAAATIESNQHLEQHQQEPLQEEQQVEEKCPMDYCVRGLCVYGAPNDNNNKDSAQRHLHHLVWNDDHHMRPSLSTFSLVPFSDQVAATGAAAGNYHCVCPEGFTGRDCGIPFEKCPGVAPTKDGTEQYHYCYHGGTCHHRRRQQTNSNEGHKTFAAAQLPACDCPPGWDGRHCEYRQPGSTSLMTTTSVANKTLPSTLPTELSCHLPCANGGVCRFGSNDIVSNDQITPTMQCTCAPGYGGVLCQHKQIPAAGAPSTSARKLSSSSSSNKACVLQCENGGVCETVVDSNDEAGLLWDGLPSSILGDNSSSSSAYNFAKGQQRCNCPDTFTGGYCQIPVNVCPQAPQIVCLHGSTCAEGDDGAYTCECSAVANATSKTGGAFCQQHRTVYCSANGPPGSYSSLNYCSNDAACNSQGACICQLGYYGPHCEFFDPSSLKAGPTAGDKAGIAFGVVAAVVLTALIAIVLVRRRRMKLREQAIVDRTMADTKLAQDKALGKGVSHHRCSTTPSEDDPVFDMGPVKDFDGNELEDVEIL